MYHAKIALLRNRLLVPLDEVALKRRHDVPYTPQPECANTSTSSTQQSSPQQSSTSIVTDYELQKEMENALGPSKPAPPALYHAPTEEGSDDEPPRPAPVVINRGTPARKRAPRVGGSRSTTGEDGSPHVVFSKKLVLDPTDLDKAMLPHGEQSPAILKPSRFLKNLQPERKKAPKKDSTKPQSTSQDNLELYLMSPPPSPHAHDPDPVGKSTVNKKSDPQRVLNEKGIRSNTVLSIDADANKSSRIQRNRSGDNDRNRIEAVDNLAKNDRVSRNKEDIAPCCKCKCVNLGILQAKGRPRIVLDDTPAITDTKKSSNCLAEAPNNNRGLSKDRHDQRDNTKCPTQISVDPQYNEHNRKNRVLLHTSSKTSKLSMRTRYGNDTCYVNTCSYPVPSNPSSKKDKGSKTAKKNVLPQQELEENCKPGGSDNSASIDNKHGRDKYLAALKKFSDGNFELKGVNSDIKSLREKQKYLNPETRTSQTIPNRYKAPEFKKNPHLSEKGESSRQLNREKHELSRNNSKQLIRFDSEQPGSPFVVKLEDGQLEDVNAVVYTPQITHGQSRSPKGSLLPVKGGSLRNPDRKRLPTSSKGQESNFQLLKDCSEDGQPVKELNAKMVTRQTIRNRSEVPELACRSSRDRSPANGVPSEDCDRELHETRTITQSVKLFRVSSQPSTALKYFEDSRRVSYHGRA